MLYESGLMPEVAEFTSLLVQQGVAAALAYLNRRTPHRYTGLFRFEGDVLRTKVLFDCNHPPARQPPPEVPLTAAYCALAGRQQAGLASPEAPSELLPAEVAASAIFYHSVFVRDAQGHAYGTLCHYDVQRCQQRTTDLPLLEAAAALLYAHCNIPA